MIEQKQIDKSDKKKTVKKVDKQKLGVEATDLILIDGECAISACIEIDGKERTPRFSIILR
jgi:uncharacterized protein with GYD domain